MTSDYNQKRYLFRFFWGCYRFRFLAERVVVEVEATRPGGRPLPFLVPFGLPRWGFGDAERAVVTET